MAYQVKVQNFEGPFDLLLHLIRKNALDIYTISVSEIAQQYLEYVEVMQSLNLDRVGDFLVMAATLAYHKSKMLLPTSPEDGVDDDDAFESLEDLHRRLIEYQRFKEAALEMHGRELLNRDVYQIHVQRQQVDMEKVEAPIKASLFDLIDAFNDIMKTAPKEAVHEVIPERIRLVDRIVEVLDLLMEKESLGFSELFTADDSRSKMIVTFLSVLELIRMQLVRAHQEESFGAIQMKLIASDDDDHKQKLKEGLSIYEP